MQYKATCVWRDLEDGHLYQTGDHFPHDGRAISVQRIEALKSGDNLAHKVLIAEVAEEQPAEAENIASEAAQDIPEAIPVQKPKTRRSAKKQPKE